MTSELTKTNLKYYDVQEHIARYECQSDKLILDGVAYDMGKKSIEFNGKLFEADTYEYQDNNESVKQTTIFGVGLYSYDFVSPYYSFDLKLEKAIIK